MGINVIHYSTDGVKMLILGLVLTLLWGACTHVGIARNISVQGLSISNLLKQTRSLEKTILPNSSTQLHTAKPKLGHTCEVLLISKCNVNHRFGNLLFMYASMYGIAHANALKPCVITPTGLQTVFENTTLDMLDSTKENQTKRINISDSKLGGRTFDQDAFHLREIFREGDIFVINGYRQSWKYFSQAWENNLENRLKFRTVIQDKIDRCLESVVSHQGHDTSLVGIHIRRGDFITQAKFGYTISNITYIENAMKYYERQNNSIMFVIATDDPHWAKEYVLPLRMNIYLSPFTSAFDDMCLLASCNDSIITGGSFGWWGAYMAGGSVVYDKTFPDPESTIGKRYTKEDYYPPHWVGL